jgi:putative endonuclease
MQYVCYILFSRTINRFYIGYTSDIRGRLKNHIDGVFGGKSFTSRAIDWEVYMIIPCGTIEKTMALEKFIKKKKSRQFIQNLKKYPELLQKISREFV